jgi:hypothetical protein
VDLGRSIKGRGQGGKISGAKEVRRVLRKIDKTTRMQVEVKTIKTVIEGKAAFRRLRMILKKPGVDKV